MKEKRKLWNKEDFINDLINNSLRDEALTAEKLIIWAERNDLNLGERTTNKSFIPYLEKKKGDIHSFFEIRTNGKIVFRFKYMKTYPIFANSQKKTHLIDSLNHIPGFNFSYEDIIRLPFPRRSLNLLRNEENLNLFINTLNWYLSQL